MYTNEINSISATNKCPMSTEAAKVLPKGNFRTNEGLLVDPGAVNEVVKSFSMVSLVRPNAYP